MRSLGRALLPSQEMVSLWRTISRGTFSCCPSEKVQHVLLGELLQWQQLAKEGAPWRRTSVRGGRIRRRKEEKENAAVVLWRVKSTNLCKKRDLIREELFNQISGGWDTKEVWCIYFYFLFFKKSGFVTLFRRCLTPVRLWLVLYSSRLVILGCFCGLHRYLHSYSREVESVSSKYKSKMDLSTHIWSRQGKCR